MDFLHKLFGKKQSASVQHSREIHSLEQIKVRTEFKSDKFALSKCFLAVPGQNSIHIWEAASGSHKGQLAGHTAEITALAFAAASEKLLTASADKTLRLWDVDNLKELASFSYESPVESLAYDAAHNKAYLILQKQDDTAAHVFHLNNGNEIGLLRAGAESIKEIVVSPDGTMAAAVTLSSGIFYFELGETTHQVHFIPSPFRFFSLRFSPDSQYLLATGGALSFKIDSNGKIIELEATNLGAAFLTELSGQKRSKTVICEGVFFGNGGWLANSQRLMIEVSSPPVDSNEQVKKSLYMYSINSILEDKMQGPLWIENIQPNGLFNCGQFPSNGSLFGVNVNDGFDLWHVDKEEEVHTSAHES